MSDAPGAAVPPPRTGADGVLAFLHLCTRLKTTKRTGWVENAIRGPESIADHMHRMGVMAMLIHDPAIDRDRCVRARALAGAPPRSLLPARHSGGDAHHTARAHTRAVAKSAAACAWRLCTYVC